MPHETVQKPLPLPGEREGESLCAAEIVIQSKVVLIQVVGPALPPLIPGRIQAIADEKIVRGRHHLEKFLHRSRRIEARPIGITTEQIHRLDVTSGASRSNWIAEEIDGGHGCIRVAVFYTREKAETALTRRWRVCDGVNDICGTLSPSFITEMKKTPVTHNRSTKTSAELIQNESITRNPDSCC